LTDVDPPSWVDVIHSAEKITDASQMVCTNGLLDLSTRTLHNHTPALFNLVSVPFDYQDDAAEPQVWLKFLESVWGDDAESIALLQEYIGYVLSGRLDMPHSFRVFQTPLQSALLIDPTDGGHKFGQWLHSTELGVQIVGAAVAVATSGS